MSVLRNLTFHYPQSRKVHLHDRCKNGRQVCGWNIEWKSRFSSYSLVGLTAHVNRVSCSTEACNNTRVPHFNCTCLHKQDVAETNAAILTCSILRSLILYKSWHALSVTVLCTDHDGGHKTQCVTKRTLVRSSGLLRSVSWWFTDISRQPICAIFKGRIVDCLTLGANRFLLLFIFVGFGPLLPVGSMRCLLFWD